MKIIHSTDLVAAAKSKRQSPALSRHYNFLPTDAVVEMLERHDYVMTSSQQRVPRDGNLEHALHLVRMRHVRDLESPKDLVSEIVIRNSHDGHRALQMMSGLFRMVCANGLISGDVNSTIRFAHNSNTTLDAVFDGSRWIVEHAEKSKQAADKWSNIELSSPAEKLFADRINAIARRDLPAIESTELFRDRYDEPRNLWTLFNNAQQTLIGGGAVDVNGRRVRAIKEVNKTIEINRELWRAADSIAERFAA